MADEVTLTVVGRPGVEVRVAPRNRGDEPPEDVFRGVLRDSGEISVKLSRGYYVVLSAGHAVPADFSDGASWKRIEIDHVI